MSLKTIFSVVAVILITGCSTLPTPPLSSSLTRVSIGMSKEEVAAILGPPTQAATGMVYEGPSVQSAGFSEVHRYLRVNRGSRQDCLVVYYRGKVTEYGPNVGNLRLRYAIFEE